MEILYEDADIVAVNKPSGLVVHSDGRTKEPSVSAWFVEKYPEARGVGEPLGEVERPGVVHRIDRETSGVLLLAKTAGGHAYLKRQFQNREIEKIYHAFVYGELKEEHGSINQPIARSKADFRKRLVLRSLGEAGGREGREAITYYRVLARGEGLTLVEAKPKTGRTHQLRVHFKFLHHPILSDKLYGSSALRSFSEAQGFSRLALHAREITFTNLKGEKKTVTAPYPEDFKRAVDSLG